MPAPDPATSLDPADAAIREYLSTALADRYRVDRSAAFIRARCGGRAEGERELQDLLVQSRVRYIPAVLLAKAYLGLGRKDEFFAWLEKAIDEHGSVTVFDPFYDEVRDVPRFIRLVAPLLPPGTT